MKIELRGYVEYLTSRVRYHAEVPAMSYEDYAVEVNALTAGLIGSKRQSRIRYWSRALAAHDANVLTQTEARQLKQKAINGSVKEAKRLRVREMMRNSDYVSTCKNNLLEAGYILEADLPWEEGDY